MARINLGGWLALAFLPRRTGFRRSRAYDLRHHPTEAQQREDIDAEAFGALKKDDQTAMFLQFRSKMQSRDRIKSMELSMDPHQDPEPLLEAFIHVHILSSPTVWPVGPKNADGVLLPTDVDN